MFLLEMLFVLSTRKRSPQVVSDSGGVSRSGAYTAITIQWHNRYFSGRAGSTKLGGK